MELPKYHETFTPILKTLNEEDNLHHSDLVKLVIEKFYSNLSDELKNLKTSSGANVLKDRIGWGKSYLKQGKFVEYPKKGYVKITKKGLNALKEGGLTLKELKEDEDFLKHRELSKQNSTSKMEISNNENETPQSLIDSGIETIKSETKLELLEKLKEINPYYFEKVILFLLNKMGYGDFIETSKSSDGGIDGIINEDKLGLDKIYIQAKRFTENKVREKDIRNFIGAMSGDTKKGVFVTTSDFDEKAVKKANDAHHSIILINGKKLVDLMHEFNVGVQVRRTFEIKELDNDFFENE